MEQKMKKFGAILLFAVFVALAGCQPTTENETISGSSVKSGSTVSQNNNNNNEPSLEITRKVVHPGGSVEYKYENGLTLLCREKKSGSAVSVNVFVKIGSIYEGEMLGSGISHYFEHVISGGTTSTYTEEESRNILRSIGNNSNAYTTTDHTGYFINTEAAHFKTAAILLGDYMSNCLISEKEFKREKGVITQEIRKNYDNPNRVSYTLLREVMFDGHPAGQPVIGHIELFKKVQRDSLIKLYKRYYVANNMVVAVCGAINPEEAAKVISKTFTDCKRGMPNHPVMPRLPVQTGTRWAEKESAKINKTYLLMGHHTVSLGEEDMYPLDVMAEILGSGRTSRLYVALRDKGIVENI
jgi:zinc protease